MTESSKNCEIAGFYPHITTESSQWDFLAEMVAYNQGISILPVPIMKTISIPVSRIKMIRLKEPELPWNIGYDFQEREINHSSDGRIYTFCCQ